MQYQLALGTLLTLSSTFAFVEQGRAAVIGIVLGIALITAGLVTRSRINDGRLGPPMDPPAH